MDFNSVYELSIIGKRTALHVEPLSEISDSRGLFRGSWRPSAPIPFVPVKGASGSRALDFVGTSEVVIRLISKRVVKALRGLSGWSTFPVEVYGKDKQPIEGYCGLAVTGACGPIDDSQSHLVIQPPRVPGGKPPRTWIGMYFDPETWDGSDVFCPPGTCDIFVTARVSEAFREHGITNVELVPLTQAENMSSALLFPRG